MNDLAHQAVQKALSCQWNEALEINKEILDKEPENVDALLRSAYAHFALGESKKAQKYARAVLAIDPRSQIALKTLERCKFKINPQELTNKLITNLDALIERPGKTFIVKLTNLGETSTINSLRAGEIITLIPTNHRVNVESLSGSYIGKFPDDSAARIIRQKKFTFRAAIKHADPKSVTVIVHEEN